MEDAIIYLLFVHGVRTLNDVVVYFLLVCVCGVAVTDLTLVGEFGGGDVQLLELLLQLGELGLQARLLQLGGVHLALQVLVV